VAQLVERNLAKVEVAGSIPVVRSTNPWSSSARGSSRLRRVTASRVADATVRRMDTPAAALSPGSQEWLDLVVEDVVDPDAPVIDPHHHLWPAGRGWPYGLDELLEDLASGHRVVDTVFVECGAAYREDEPRYRAPVGETEYVTVEAERAPRQVMGGIVAHADLTDHDHLDEVLDAHEQASNGRLRGIRHAGSHAEHPEVLSIPGRAPRGLYADPAFRRGIERLGERGLTYDTWHYHYQNAEFADLARAVPGTTMVLDHFGTPLGVGPYASRREEIHAMWRDDIVAIAQCENVVAKLGGLAMPDNGFGWDRAGRPPSSDEFVAAQRSWYLHTIEQFGPDRCMFESNFPVDRRSLSYRVVWNGFKKMVADFLPGERDAMLRGTAARVYRL
jgi:L-fuconolactonase